jgi:hypothetical protein
MGEKSERRGPRFDESVSLVVDGTWRTALKIRLLRGSGSTFDIAMALERLAAAGHIERSVEPVGI